MGGFRDAPERGHIPLGFVLPFRCCVASAVEPGPPLRIHFEKEGGTGAKARCALVTEPDTIGRFQVLGRSRAAREDDRNNKEKCR